MHVIDIFLEMDKEKFKLALLNSVVNMILVFLVMHIVVGIFNISAYINLGISAVVFFLSMRYYMHRFDLEYVQRKNDMMREMLRTARDTMKNQENIITKMFFQDVAKHVRNISFGNLVSMKTFIARVFLIVVISFALILMPPIKSDFNFLSGLFDGKNIQDNIALKDNTDVLGDPNIINLGNEQIQINIQKSNNEIDFNTIKEIEQVEFSRNLFPTDVGAVSDTPSNEKEPEDFDLIKEYNLRIRQTA